MATALRGSPSGTPRVVHFEKKFQNGFWQTFRKWGPSWEVSKIDVLNCKHRKCSSSSLSVLHFLFWWISRLQQARQTAQVDRGWTCHFREYVTSDGWVSEVSDLGELGTALQKRAVKIICPSHWQCGFSSQPGSFTGVETPPVKNLKMIPYQETNQIFRPQINLRPSRWAQDSQWLLMISVESLQWLLGRRVSFKGKLQANQSGNTALDYHTVASEKDVRSKVK